MSITYVSLITQSPARNTSAAQVVAYKGLLQSEVAYLQG